MNSLHSQLYERVEKKPLGEGTYVNRNVIVCNLHADMVKSTKLAALELVSYVP